MRNGKSIVHYWGGQPQVRTSRFDWHLAILDRCRRKGWQPTMVFSGPSQDEEIREALVESKIQCLYIERPERQFDLRCIRDTYRMFKKVACTIAHFHCVHTSPIIGAALARVPIRIWSNHSSEYRDDGQSLSWIHRLGGSTRVTCALAHKILPVSASIRDELRRYGVPENRMCVAPVPISLKRYTSCPQARKMMRASLGFSDDQIVVCSVGQGIYRKGWDVLIRAFVRAYKKVPQMQLLLIGAMTKKTNGEPDAYQKSLLRLVDDLKIQNQVRFLGVRHDIADILSASDIFAFPSRAEGLPLALVEAMAAGVACIASSVSGIPEAIEDGENGLLVEKEDVEAFSKGLVRLATNEILRSRLGGKAVSSLEVFSLEYQAKRVAKLYDDLLTERGLAEAKDAHDS